jgi:hypothetical protein
VLGKPKLPAIPLGYQREFLSTLRHRIGRKARIVQIAGQELNVVDEGRAVTNSEVKRGDCILSEKR